MEAQFARTALLDGAPPHALFVALALGLRLPFGVIVDFPIVFPLLVIRMARMHTPALTARLVFTRQSMAWQRALHGIFLAV